MALIHETLPKVASEINYVEKSSKHQQGYSFRGIDAALAACAPIFRKYQLSAVPEVLRHKLTERLEDDPTGKRPAKSITRALVKMRVTFFAADGSSVSAVTVGEALDYSGDRASNKAMATAYKYALFLGLTLPVDASCMEDADCAEAPVHHERPAAAPSANGNGKPPVDLMGDAEGRIKACASVDALNALSVRMMESLKFTPDQKKQLGERVADRLEQFAAATT